MLPDASAHGRLRYQTTSSAPKEETQSAAVEASAPEAEENVPEPADIEVWARVDKDGYIESMMSVVGNKGFPNFVYGKKLD